MANGERTSLVPNEGVQGGGGGAFPRRRKCRQKGTMTHPAQRTQVPLQLGRATTPGDGLAEGLGKT